MTKPKIHICYLIGGHEGGGSARSISQLLECLDRSRHNVSILSCGEGPFYAKLREIGYSCTLVGTGWPPRIHGQAALVVSLLHLFWWTCRSIFRTYCYLRRQQVDVIHGNYFHFNFVAAMAACIAHKKCVFHWRGLLRGRFDRACASLSHVLLGSGAWSISNSNSTARSLPLLCQRRGSVIYNGVELDQPPGKGHLREMLKLSFNAPIVGIVGSLTPIKGHDQFLLMAAEIKKSHPGVHYVIIGGETAAGQAQHVAHLHDMCTRLGLKNLVHFLGHHPKPSTLVVDFDVSVVTTLPPGEGFGLVAIEAMSLALPIVAYACGALPEIVINERTGYLAKPLDVIGMATRVIQLLDDADLRRRLGTEAAARVKQFFTIDRTVSQVEAVYMNINSIR